MNSTLPLKPLCSLLPGMLGLGPFDRHSSQSYVSENSVSQHLPDAKQSRSLHDAWSASRVIGEHEELILTPGGQRPLTGKNMSLALEVAERCLPQMLSLLWSLHPLRVLLMLSLDIFRGVLPACRGYSQALIINEVCSFRVFPVTKLNSYSSKR
jgi:hypothetical protein